MDRSLMQYCNMCKISAGFYCNGCNKIFCQYHANEHRQSLYEQLDWLTVDHDDLVHTFDNNSLIIQKLHPSRKIIDKWEEESIEHIQKTANEARHALMDAIKTHINDLKEKLKLLTEKLNEIHNTDDNNNNNNNVFDERNIKQWATEIHNLKHEFNTMSTFTVRIHGNKPVVMPIIKVQPDDSHYENHSKEQQQNTSGLIPIKNSTNQNEFSSSNIKQERSTPRTSIDHNSNLLSEKDDRFYLNSNHVKILDYGQLIIHDSTNNDSSIRGLHEYSQDEHKLYFHIEHMTSNEWIFFGIISKHTSHDEKAYRNSSAYGWTGYNNVYINGKSMPVLNGYINDMKVNDFIELTIDCNNQTLFLWHSRQTYKIKLPVNVQTCPFPWQFLISCHNPNDSIRILPLSIGSIIKREQDKLINDIKIKNIKLNNGNDFIPIR